MKYFNLGQGTLWCDLLSFSGLEVWCQFAIHNTTDASHSWTGEDKLKMLCTNCCLKLLLQFSYLCACITLQYKIELLRSQQRSVFYSN